MRTYSLLPLSAFLVICLIQGLIYIEWIPPGIQFLEGWQSEHQGLFYLFLLAIILLESIVYLGFYLPGQFIAVVLVVLSSPDSQAIVYLTLAMVTGATLGSIINLCLGRFLSNDEQQDRDYSIKQLLLAMIHINALAFFMFNRGLGGGSFKIVWLAGLLNLPYYLLLIALTAWLSEEVMQLAESPWLLLGIVSIWLMIALKLDWQQGRFKALLGRQ